jgi:arylsulfatase A-like enzyme
LFRHHRIAALVGLILLSGCGGPTVPADGPRSVVLIVIDTLRADYLGSYGFGKDTSPFLDELAARGIRFADVTTTAPVTAPSVASILTGLIPPAHGLRDNAGFVLADDRVSLAERFQDAGWKTGAVVGSAVLSADRGLDQGFDAYRDQFGGEYPVYDPTLAPLQEQLGADRRRADQTTDLALDLLRDFGNAPHFLLVHYFDVHDYYDPPPQHGQRFPGNPYAGEIHFVDAEIRRLLAAVGEDALVVVVSDHGEGLGDHGETGHGFLLQQSTLRVPLIVAGPGVPRGLVREDPVSTIDIPATIASSAGLATLGSGRALVWDEPDSGPPPHYAETMRTLLSYQWSHLRALRNGPFKLVEGPTDEFYNVAADPGELQPLDPEQPEARWMRTWLRELVAGDDPEQLFAMARDPDPERLETLASLGYAGGTIEPGRARPSVEEYWRPHPKSQLEKWERRQRNRPYYRQAIQLLQQEQFESAVVALDSFLRTEPRHASALYNRGLALRQLGREAEAMDSFRAAVDADPDHVQALEVLSMTHVRRGELETALPLLQDLALLTPDEPGVQYNLGVCALRLDRPTAARDALERFLELAPSDPRADSVRQTLAGLR